MKTRKFLPLLIPVGILLTTVFILAGCASKKNIWGSKEKGLILSYRFPESNSLKYIASGDMVQNMEMMGQKFEVTLKNYQVYSLKTDDPSSDPLTLDITVDTMYLKMKTPMNETTPGMEEVIGRNFAIKLTPIGKESDFSQAEEITFQLGGETRSLSAEFQGFFPDFPANPVKPGDSWSYQDTIKEESGGNWLHLYINCTATLEGYETLSGRECVRVTVHFSGTLLGEGITRQVEMKTTGDISGTDTYFFDYKEGILVKIRSEVTASSVTKTSGEREMTIPATREFAKEVVLEE